MNDTDKTQEQLLEEIARLTAENEQLKTEKEEMARLHENCEFRLNAVSEARDILQKFIDYNPLSIQIVDKDGKHLSMNEAHTRLFKEIPDENFCLFTHPPLIALGFKKHLELLKRGEVVFFPEHPYTAPHQKKEVWLKATAFAVLDENKQPVQYIIMHEDITEKTIAEENIHELTNTIHEKMENEKKLFTDNLHATIVQELKAIKSQIELKIKKSSDARFEDFLKELSQKLENIIDESLLVCMKYMPADFDPEKPFESFEGYVMNFESLENIDVSMKIEKEIKLTEKGARNLFDVLDESLSNIATHAQASRVEISLHQNNGMIVFEIKDNGIGIDELKIESMRSIGIRMMKEKIRALGGIIKIAGLKGGGTEININVPLESNVL